MITRRPSSDRGHIDHGWLNAKHSFSFAGYYDPAHMGFRALRVINEDVVAPRMGFSEHPHRNMEIITYPIAGRIRHGDSLGHSEDIGHGMVQAMTAGRGIRHSESNPHSEPVHLLQIWIEPRAEGLEPTHASRTFPVLDEPGRFHTIVSGDGEDGSLTIQRDARVLAGIFEAGTHETVVLGEARHAWVQVVRGSLTVNGVRLEAGDGAAASDESALELRFTDATELLVFDLD